MPPQSPETEKTIVGSVLINGEILENLHKPLKSEWFYYTANRKIVECFNLLHAKQTPVDLITVSEELKRKEWLDDVGGVGYLSELCEEVNTVTNINHYVKIIYQKYLLRSLITISAEVTNEAFNPDANGMEIINFAESKLFHLSETNEVKKPELVSDIIPKVFEKMEAQRKNKGISGINTGFLKLNQKLGGWQKGDLVILAARPGMGKTSLALNYSLAADVPTAIFSLEMPRIQLTERLMSITSQVSSYRMRNGQINRAEMERLGIGASKVHDSKIIIDDSAELNIPILYGKTRKLIKQYGLKLLIVDYLQLMGSSEKGLSIKDRVSEISRGLKLISQDLNIPVIALSQLSRALESRPLNQRRPILSDLRESGTIEQDADIVIFVYRAFEYTKENSDLGKAEMIVAKHRNGATGIVNCSWLEDYTSFTDSNTEEEVAF